MQSKERIVMINNQSDAFKEFRRMVDINKKNLDGINSAITEIQDNIGTLLPYTHVCYTFERTFSENDTVQENLSIQWNPKFGKLEAVLYLGGDSRKPLKETRWHILSSPAVFRLKPHWDYFLKMIIEIAKNPELKKYVEIPKG